MKKISLILFTFHFSFLTCFSQVVINEYSCSNLSSSSDNFGQYEDWIELYNTSGSAVNLAGYHLSDIKTNTTKWTFGNDTITANGFMRVWASGRGINTGANLHTNFKLTQCKPESIIFSDAAGNIIDSLTFKPTQIGHSRGRITDGAPSWGVFISPTPNASNTNPYLDYATTPTMNVAPGFYAGTQNVTITTPDPNITIRYTTNGTTPTAASTVYSSSVTISTTSVLRAKAFSSTANIPASFIESNTYFINSSHTTAVISVFGDQIATLMSGNQINPPTGIEYFDSTGTFLTESFGECNKHGNDSWSYPQRGIDFVSRDEYGYNYALLNPLFNLKTRARFQRVILKASGTDNYPFENPGNPFSWGPPSQLGACHIRDAYVHTVSQKAHLHLDERTWAPAVLYVNGNYWGVYELREKVDDQDFTHYYYNSPSKYSTSTNQDSLQMLKTWGATWSEYGGNTAQNDWGVLVNFITINNMAVQANYDYADSLLDVKSLADYFILNSYCVNSEWLNWDTEWWRAKNINAVHKKWRYTLWDEDATFHHYINYTGIPNDNANAAPCDPQTFGDPGGQGHVPILNALLQNPNYYQYFILRYFDLLNTGLSCQRMTDILDSMINVITPEMPGQINKWGGSMVQWKQNVLDLRNFILARCDSVQQYFDDCYGTAGPFPFPITGPLSIKVNVVPAISGTVELNSINLTSFVWSGNYPGNINISFVAHADSGYCFDHWEFQNHTPLPSINDTAVTINLTTTDSIIAHFIPCISQVANLAAETGKVEVYPNPAGEKLNISLEGSSWEGTYIVRIKNLLGQSIFSGQFNKTKIQIDTAKMPKGFFLLEISTEDGKIYNVKKVILQ